MTQDNTAYSDEISLVDLATIFVRRIWLFIAILVLFVLGGIVFALVQDEQYEYVSLYQIAEVEQGDAVEKPAKAIAVLESQKLPEVKAAYKAEHDKRMPFGISTSNPENTSLVRLATDATRENTDEVKTLHTELLTYLKTRHERLLDSARSSLEARVESVQRTLDALKAAPDAGQAVAEVMQKQVELEGQLAALEASEVLVTARESVERVAPNRKLIVVLAAVIGFILAFLAVFFAEFVLLVRQNIREQKRTNI